MVTGLILAMGFSAAWESLTRSEYQRLAEEWLSLKSQSPNIGAVPNRRGGGATSTLLLISLSLASFTLGAPAGG